MKRNVFRHEGGNKKIAVVVTGSKLNAGGQVLSITDLNQFIGVKLLCQKTICISPVDLEWGLRRSTLYECDAVPILPLAFIISQVSRESLSPRDIVWVHRWERTQTLNGRSHGWAAMELLVNVIDSGSYSATVTHFWPRPGRASGLLNYRSSMCMTT